MTQYALIPTQRGENVPDCTPGDPEMLDYFILVELADSGMEGGEAPPPIVFASLRETPRDAVSVHACSHAEPGWHAAPAAPMDADMMHLCG